MPLARIDLLRGKTAEHRATIGTIVYEAMVATLKVPANDRFQVIAEHDDENYVVDPTYLGIERSRDTVLIQITLNEGRSIEVKQAFYKAVADALVERLGMRPQDVFINLVEVKKENWSFGNGEAQYA